VSSRLNRPDRKNPLTFRVLCRAEGFVRSLVKVGDVRAIVLTGAAGTSAPVATCTKSSGRSRK